MALHPEKIVGSGVWSSPGYPVEIEYPLALLDEVRRQSVAGMNALGHGGLEIGGILYGTRTGGRYRLVAAEPIACEHASGPGFLLSPRDLAGCASLLEKRSDLEPLGWYASQTRKGSASHNRDSALFDALFPGVSAIGLSVEPHGDSLRAALCFRRPGEDVIYAPPESWLAMECRGSALERRADETSPPELPPSGVSLVRSHRQTSLGPPTPEDWEDLPAPGEAADISTQARPAIRSVPAPSQSPPNGLPARGRLPRRAWIAAAGLACVPVLVLAFVFLPDARLRRSAGIELRAYPIAQGQMCIVWNRSSRAITAAKSGVLVIQDGAVPVRLTLGRDQLNLSSITYAYASPVVTLRLRAEGAPGRPVVESSFVFRGAPAPRFDAQSPEPPAPVGVLDVTVPEAHRMPPESVPDSGAREIRRASMPVAPPPQPEPPPARGAPKPFILPADGSRNKPSAAESAQAFPSPPPIANFPSAPAPAPPARLPLGPAAPPPPAPRLPLASTSPVPLAPARAKGSGRLLWTGELQRGETIEIDGNRASSGGIWGTLPQSPIAVRVALAEFKHGSLLVRTTDAALHGRREDPSPFNGWNPTTYEWDPAHAADLTVVERPGRANGFARLVLRCEQRHCSAFLIEWSAP